jgi:chemotaxis protein MotB
MNQNWQRRKEHVNHTDDWLMTYADMITLLLCFFAIFLSVSVPKKKDAQQRAKIPAAQQPVKLPDILVGNLPFYSLLQAAKAEGAKIDDTPVQPVNEVSETGPDNAAQVSLQGKGSPEQKTDKPSAPSTSAPVAVADAVPPASGDKSYAALLEIINRLKSQGPSSIEQQGDRITTLQMSSAAFFGSGSAGLSESGRSILKDVAENIKSDKYRDYQVTVEGHTDDGAIRTRQFPSNWELSTARAAAVVHFLLQQGIPAQKLRAAGYADTFPVAPNRDSNGKAIPENQARNRRVVIKLEKIDKTS